MSYRELMIYFI